MMDMYSQMAATAKNVGMNIIGKHKAAKLFAVCAAFGDESFVFNKKLSKEIMIAGKLYGIQGTCEPEKEIKSLITNYYKDLQEGTAVWVDDLNAEYGTEFKRKMEGDGREKLIWPSTHT